MSVEVSIVVPIRQARETIRQTIESLERQCEGQRTEVLLCIEQGDGSLEGVAVREPFLVHQVPAPAGVPQLRRAGAVIAKGDYVLITEDHCRFASGWLEGVLQAARQTPGLVVGGPVENGRVGYVGWAQYFTRYTAFLPTGPDRMGGSLPGNNACYPSEYLKAHQALLVDGFWEAEFNAELFRAGVRFFLKQDLGVTQYQHRGAAEYVSLRFRHGRCYGARRFAQSAAAEKVRLWLFSPLLPALLYWRMLRWVLRAQWHRADFLRTIPLVAFYVLAWSAGEVTGYLFGAGSTCVETD